VSLRSELCVVMSVTISAYNRCSVRLYLQLFVGGSMSYLRSLCLFAHSVEVKSGKSLGSDIGKKTST
jgi:hypothetical protein